MSKPVSVEKIQEASTAVREFARISRTRPRIVVDPVAMAAAQIRIAAAFKPIVEQLRAMAPAVAAANVRMDESLRQAARRPA